jgi:hypothetical protein
MRAHASTLAISVTVLASLLALPAPPAAAAESPAAAALPGIAAKTSGMEKRQGLLNLYIDRQHGKIWLEVPAPAPATSTAASAGADGEPGNNNPGGGAGGAGGEGVVASYLYVEGLLTGLGSAPLGLDRGQLGDARLVTLRRLGGRVLIEEPNLRFRALSKDAAERQSVRESFATAVVWGGEIAAEDADGRALVDFTSFVVRDAHNVVRHLKSVEEGSWTLEAGRSAIDLGNCLSFPENLELEALLTYGSADPGRLVAESAPGAGAMTLVEHQSLLRLPAEGYRPRRFDPRMGSFAVEFADYATPLGAGIDTRWLVRHRLEKVDPAAPRSPVKKPLVYYVDSGTPEPVRSALIEGASWWKEAFDKAGFIDAFRVELLPAGVNPLDARYNVIQWVHRATRGWSYGGGIVDPRTGQMIKGQVTLGSLRVRQDVLLFEGLAGADRTGSGEPDDPVTLSLARIRQLAAHEVGHSLGFAHNFAASTYGRASVMDYPGPLVTVTPAGELDFSHAYAAGIGEWDVEAVRYAYGQFAPGADERRQLDAIVRDAQARGMLFLTDEDARPAGAAQPLANLWDNGADPVEGLRQALGVRRVALARFGAHNVAPGRPLALLQEVLAPVYLYHRYQLDGALKVVGGLDYTYALRGEGAQESRPVDAAWQRRALAAVLAVLSPATLDLPEPVVRLLLPRPHGYRRNVEMFRGGAEPAFDPLAAAATAADMVVHGLLQAERTKRLVDFHRRDPRQPSLEEVLQALVDTAFAAPARGGAHGAGSGEDERQAELRRVVQWVVVRGMLRADADPETSAAVHARVEGELAVLRRRLERRRPAGAGTAAGRAGDGMDGEASQRAFLAGEIARWLDRRSTTPARQTAPPEPPPGQPIGADSPEHSWGGGAPSPADELWPGLEGCSWPG